VLDGSSSVNFDIVTSQIVDNFALVLGWVVNVSEDFFLSSGDNYFGVIQYSQITNDIDHYPNGTAFQT